MDFWIFEGQAYMYRMNRRYRLCSVDPFQGAYRLKGAFPRWSVSESFCEARDNRGNVVRHAAETGFDAARPMVAFDVRQAVELPAGSTEIDLELVVSDDASSQAGHAEFLLESAQEVRRIDGDLLKLPLGCYQTDEPPMTLTVDTWDLLDRESMLHAARVIRDCYTDIDAARALVESIALPSDTIVTRAVSPLPGTGVVVLHSQRRVMVWIAGTTQQDQLLAQAEQMVQGPRSQGQYSTAPIWARGSDIVFDVMSQAGVDATKDIVLCGHSMGGAIAYVIATRLAIFHGMNRTQVLTFGAPRPGDERMRSYLVGMRTRAIRNDGDVVPFTCPHIDELPGILQTAWMPHRRKIDAWLDPPSPSGLYEDGRLVMGGATGQFTAHVGTIAARALSGQGDFVTIEHEMDKYVQRLSLRP
jgi:hypothetical protein